MSDKRQYTFLEIAKELDCSLGTVRSIASYYLRPEMSQEDLDDWRKVLPGSLDEVAERTGISEAHLERMLADGYLKGFDISPDLGGGKGLFVGDVICALWYGVPRYLAMKAQEPDPDQPATEVLLQAMLINGRKADLEAAAAAKAKAAKRRKRYRHHLTPKSRALLFAPEPEMILKDDALDLADIFDK